MSHCDWLEPLASSKLAPSALPGISPTGGEITIGELPTFIEGTHPQPATLDSWASGCAQPISPPVGEMPGRAEGAYSLNP